jgi:hypothetical protein
LLAWLGALLNWVVGQNISSWATERGSSTAFGGIQGTQKASYRSAQGLFDEI